MFSEQERQIYTCPFSGRKFDPLAVKRAIAKAAQGKFNELVTADDTDGLIAVGRVAFGFAPVDPETGVGVLDATVYDALTAFTKWLAGKGQRAQSGPDSTPCTGCP